MEIVFVYGTLRQGYHNHRLIIDCKIIEKSNGILSVVPNT